MCRDHKQRTPVHEHYVLSSRARVPVGCARLFGLLLFFFLEWPLIRNEGRVCAPSRRDQDHAGVDGRPKLRRQGAAKAALEH